MLLASVHGHIITNMESSGKQIRLLDLSIPKTEAVCRYNTMLYCNLMLYSITPTISVIISMLGCYTAIDLVMVGLVYKVYPDGCRHVVYVNMQSCQV